MKMLLSYNDETCSIAVCSVVEEENAKNEFRKYVKERAMNILDIDEEEAEALIADDGSVESGLSYNEETGTAAIFIPGHLEEVISLVDAPKLPVSKDAYYSKEDEIRMEDAICCLKEEACIDGEKETPEQLKKLWRKFTAGVPHIFDRYIGSNDVYWELYWEMLRDAVEEAKNSAISDGIRVEHKKHGTGKVVSIEGEKISVLFGKEQKDFPYPGAFVNGQLSVTDN